MASTSQSDRDQIAAEVEATLTKQVDHARALRLTKTEKFGNLDAFRTVRDITEGVVQYVSPNKIPLLLGAALNRLAQLDTIVGLDEIADLDFEVPQVETGETDDN